QRPRVAARTGTFSGRVRRTNRHPV
ncbi:uncharacterized protein METZ01_LOCUS224835, partial [marine metagenome]